MSGVNRVILVGHLGKDPEVRVFESGDRVASFSIATSEKWKDKASGEQKSKTEWHNMVVRGPLASVCEKYLNKGSQAYFEGKMATRKYTDKNNIERSITEVIVQKMHMLDGKDSKSTGTYEEPNGNIAPMGNSFDDDIPF